MTLVGGIDLGGTKIDAQLFDAGNGWARQTSHEIATPTDDYGALVTAIAAQVKWLREHGAASVGEGQSIGINVALPHEQAVEEHAVLPWSHAGDERGVVDPGDRRIAHRHRPGARAFQKQGKFFSAIACN